MDNLLTCMGCLAFLAVGVIGLSVFSIGGAALGPVFSVAIIGFIIGMLVGCVVGVAGGGNAINGGCLFGIIFAIIFALLANSGVLMLSSLLNWFSNRL